MSWHQTVKLTGLCPIKIKKWGVVSRSHSSPGLSIDVELIRGNDAVLQTEGLSVWSSPGAQVSSHSLRTCMFRLIWDSFKSFHYRGKLGWVYDATFYRSQKSFVFVWWHLKTFRHYVNLNAGHSMLIKCFLCWVLLCLLLLLKLVGPMLLVASQQICDTSVTSVEQEKHYSSAQTNHTI